MEQVFDVVIIGGGINGCGCAADAALRGLSVFLCEQDDLASKTSSKSSQLIHGGLRYLEHYDFSLVKKALNERQILLNIVPHLVHPLPIVLPHQPQNRPLWLLQVGLFLYDHLSKINQLPHSQRINRKRNTVYFTPLAPDIQKGMRFYDAATDDARLTIANAIQAKEHGAFISTNTKLRHAETNGKLWQLTLQHQEAPPFKIMSKSLINATGPWIGPVSQFLKIPLQQSLSLVKGSHLVVPKLYEGDHAYLLQHEDNRVVFVMPYHGYTAIGTTDVMISGPIQDLEITPNEITYLCKLVNQFFNTKITSKDIITTWSGVRPLLAAEDKTASTLSRDYSYHYTSLPAPAVTIYGGKITTYRQLASEVIDTLRIVFSHLPDTITNKVPLPGSDSDYINFEAYQEAIKTQYLWLDPATKKRYLTCYGTRMDTILEHCHEMSDLGTYFAPTLYQREVDYLIANEWACTADDILWRRTKTGLMINSSEKEKLSNYLRSHSLFSTIMPIV